MKLPKATSKSFLRSGKNRAAKALPDDSKALADQPIRQIAKNYFINTGKPIQEAKLFQYPFPDQLWENIRLFIRNLSNLPLWVSKELSETVFGGKNNNNFWQTVFETGKTPQGLAVLVQPLNLIDMIKP